MLVALWKILWRSGGRDAAGLLPLLVHLAKHLADPRHSDLFIGVANRILDIYAPAVRNPPFSMKGFLDDFEE